MALTRVSCQPRRPTKNSTDFAEMNICITARQKYLVAEETMCPFLWKTTFLLTMKFTVAEMTRAMAVATSILYRNSPGMIYLARIVKIARSSSVQPIDVKIKEKKLRKISR